MWRELEFKWRVAGVWILPQGCGPILEPLQGSADIQSPHHPSVGGPAGAKAALTENAPVGHGPKPALHPRTPSIVNEGKLGQSKETKRRDMCNTKALILSCV